MKTPNAWLPRLLLICLGALGTAVEAQDLALPIPAASLTTVLPPAASNPATPPDTPPEPPGWDRLPGSQDRFVWRFDAEQGSGNAVVSIGHDAVLDRGNTADAVTALFGDAHVDGMAGQVVVLFGNAYVDSHVSGGVVALFGNVELGPQADIGRDVVVIDGRLQRDPAAAVHGQVQQILIGTTHWLRPWIEHGLLYGRPLALVPGLGWAWFLALAMLAFYLLLAAGFHGGVERCAYTLESRPGASCLAALLIVLLAPILFGLLFVSILGITLIPFLALVLFIAGLFGKVVIFAWLGRRLLRPAADNPRARTVLAVLIGGAIVLALYLIPFVGFILYKLIGILGIGVVAYTVLLALKQEQQAAPAAAGMAPPAAPDAPAPAPAAPAATAGAEAGPRAEQTAAGATQAAPIPPSTLPRAGFWIRMAALFLDALLVGIVLHILVGRSSGGELLVLAAYGAVMWKLRGTTVGGIICGLALVRVDGRPIDWSTAIVRALGCFLSLAVALLGFIWIVFDPERQAWHDKIAGTVVVRAPRHSALV
jgi:uncharacterized RDD family membrane protein YckC